MATAYELQQRRYPSTGNQADAAPAPAVAAVRAAEGHELLASERHDAVTAVPSFYPDAAFVDVNTHASVCRLRPGQHASTELCVPKAPTPTGYPRRGSVLRRTMQSPRLCESTGVLRLLT